MKLELKHLAPYLPYRLKVYHEDNSAERMEYELRADIVRKYGQKPLPFERIAELQILNTDQVVSRRKFKPILHPFSDLTKEIEHRGERFVPLVELAKIAFQKADKHNSVYGYIDIGHDYSFHLDRKEMSFDCRKGYDGNNWDSNYYVPNQLQLFQKLFEWHFDLFELIEQGLAIDINTLEESLDKI